MKRWMLLMAIIGHVLVGCGGGEPEALQCNVASCDDGIPCTLDCLQGSKCTNPMMAAGSICDDGNHCTFGATCDSAGICLGGDPIVIEQRPCETCSCTPEKGIECEWRSIGDYCNDGDCCKFGRYCDWCNPNDPDCDIGTMVCLGTDVDCVDDNDCSEDTCSCENGEPSCGHENKENGVSCDFSENDCTQNDACLSGQCQPGKLIDLNDNNPCTLDFCEKGAVIHQPLLVGTCNDGDECTIDDNCHLGSCVGGEAFICPLGDCASSVECITGEGCVEAPLPKGAACDDENLCTLESNCNEDRECVPTKIESCDDFNACTLDSCDIDTGECSNTLLEGSCDDGNACTQNDECKQDGSCVGELTTCPDDNPCMQTTCNAASGLCDLPKPEGTPCVDDNLCNGDETCKSGTCSPSEPVDCSDVANPCLQKACNPITGSCDLKKPNGTFCEDGNQCTTSDTCDDGFCAPGGEVACALPACAGSVSCEPANGCIPAWLPQGAECDDNNPCTPASSCDTSHSCEATSEVDCNDGNPCTLDSCDTFSGDCVHIVQAIACDDASLCTTGDMCQENGSCEGSPVDCSDVTALCLETSCNPTTGACDLPKANFTPCPDGDLCNGNELCQTGECLSGAPVVCTPNPGLCKENICQQFTGACVEEVSLGCCGNTFVEGGETCDDGNVETEVCGYGETSCLVCNSGCQSISGVTSFCGDSLTNPDHGETCDDGNAVTEACDYGLTNCIVCNEACANMPGATAFCGNGAINALDGEECDDGNTVTEVCSYDETTCTVCNSTCTLVAGATSLCGDGAIDAASGETCDDGNTITEVCPYSVPSCTVCDGTCSSVPGETALCGDNVVDIIDGENCDDGNIVTEICDYGLTSCNVCNAGCQITPGITSYCGDSLADGNNGENCDDGNAFTEACAYGLTSCTVCSSICTHVPGAISVCGDGVTDVAGGEHCDDGNTVTEACEYGAISCIVCSSTCTNVAGATSLCGDGSTDPLGGEQCDDSNTTTEVCDYGETSCTVCDSACQSVAGATSFCSDNITDPTNSETCDDGNTITEGCDYGLTSCTICNANCQSAAGLTTYCGDSVTDGDNGEFCDDGNVITEVCDYGETACTVCSNTCANVPGVTSVCGDLLVDAGAGEECDDGNALTEICVYGETACTVCNNICHSEAGVTSYCGDTAVDGGNGEVCDDSNVVTEVCDYGLLSCIVCDSVCSSVPGATAYCGDDVVQPLEEDCDGSDCCGCTTADPNPIGCVIPNTVTSFLKHKVIASDGEANEFFGFAFAISGGTLVAGAEGDDDLGPGSGSAYVFTRGSDWWTEAQKLTASDGDSGDLFGHSVAISGDTVVIGAILDELTDPPSKGSAYVFTFRDGSWEETQKLNASDAGGGDKFGTCVAIGGDTLFVAAEGENSGRGAIYVFIRSGETWNQTQKLIASDGTNSDFFGHSISMHENTLVVGATGVDDIGSGAGAAYVFVSNAGVWEEAQKLTASDGYNNDRFGDSVSVSGDTVVVGAHGNGDEGANTGSAYVYVRQGGLWSEKQKLLAGDANAGDWFGYTLSIDGDMLAIGAPYDDHIGIGSNSGSVYLFIQSGGTWNQYQKFLADDAAAGDLFAYSVFLSGGSIGLGARYDSDLGSSSGAAYIFEATANCTSPDTCECKPGFLVPDCAVTECGDGIQAGFETCDDGNTVAGDGCDANCVSEACDVLEFDGTDDYIYIGEEQNMLNITNAFTVSAWIYRMDDFGHGIFDGEAAWSGTPSQNAGIRLLLRGNGRIEGFYGTGFQGDGPSLTTDEGAVPLNEWAHVAFARNGSNAAIYVNGSAIASSNGMGAQNISYNGNMYEHDVYVIGAVWDWDVPAATSEKFASFTRSLLKDVAVWRRQLSNGEVSDLYTSGVSGSLNVDLAGYWRLNDGSGVIAQDTSGGGHPGSLLNGLDAGWTTTFGSICDLP